MGLDRQVREVHLATVEIDTLRCLSQVLEELAAFTFAERQLLVRRVIELDDPPLSEADEALVESRLAAHRLDPALCVPANT